MRASWRRRATAIALGAVLVVSATSCSDAYTDTDKAWADDGVDPRIVTIFAPPRLDDLVHTLVERYERADHHGRFLFAFVEDDVAADRVADSPTPAIWFGPEPAIDAGAEPDERAPIGIDLLGVASRAEDGVVAQPLSTFGADDGRRSALCLESLPCGESGRAALEQADVTPAPDEVGTEAEIAMMVFDGKVDVALVHRTFSTVLFPRILGFSLPPADSDPIAFLAARFGDNPTSVLFMGWLENQTDLGPLILESTGMVPSTPTP